MNNASLPGGNDHKLPRGIRITESRNESLPVDSTGVPVVPVCLATGCDCVDTKTYEKEPGVAYVVVCARGHVALMRKKDEE